MNRSRDAPRSRHLPANPDVEACQAGWAVERCSLAGWPYGSARLHIAVSHIGHHCHFVAWVVAHVDGRRGRTRSEPSSGGGPGTARTILRPGNVQAGQASSSQPASVNLPLAPNVAALPQLPNPPAAVIGVLAIPEIMRQSLAGQEAERTLGAQQQRLRQDVQAEQATWRTMQQELAGQQRRLTPDQLHMRSRALQERITAAQQRLRQRSDTLQREGQMALGVIKQTLVAVVRQIAESRGMNLVIEGETSALYANDFDITKQVIERLNAVLPTVKQLMVEGPTSSR